MFATHATDGTVRYEMLDYIAEFGQEKLREARRSSPVAPAPRALVCRACRWVPCGLDRGRAGRPAAAGASGDANVRAALQFCATDPAQPEAMLTIVTDLDSYWVTTGLADEARHWLEAGLATGRGKPADRTLAMVLAARFAGLQHDLVEAHAWLANATAATEA